MAGDVKQRIVLEGEQEYKQALKDAQRQLKVLRSELKAETAELGKNATEQQKSAVKTKNLQKQIAEQEKIVKTYKAALEEVKEKYGDNADAVAQWETRLNDARTTLANLRNSLMDVGQGFEAIETGASNSAVETNALAESFGRISEAGDAMSGALESVFMKVIGTISEAISSIWSDLMAVATRADQYFDLAAFLGASATDVQKWDYAMKSVSGDISSITNLVSRLKYGGKADKVTEWFGISSENYTNDLEYAEAVLQKMYDMKDEMVSAGTWDNAMEDIFGARRTQEVDGILSDWEQIQNSLNHFEGKGLGEEELQTMADLQYQVGVLTQSWDAFKSKVETQLFGKLALNLTGNAQRILDAFIELLDADTEEERDAAVKKIEEELTAAFTAIGEALENAAKALDEVGTNLQGSENGYVKLMGDLLKSLSDVLEWFTKPDSLEQVKSFLEGFFNLWLTTKALGALANVASLATNIATIKSAGWLSQLFNGGTPTGAPTAAPTTTGAATGTGTSTVIAAKGGAGGALQSVMSSAVILLPAALLADQVLHSINIQAETAEAINIARGEISLMEETYKDVENPIKGIWEEFGGVISDAGSGTYGAMFTRLMEGMAGLEAGEDNPWFDLLYDVMSDELTQELEDIYDKWLRLGDEGVAGDKTQLVGDIYNWLSQLMADPSKLPAWAFEKDYSVDGLNQDDINTFRSAPAQMAKAVREGVSGISVTMDGAIVGSLVAPYVSQYIARQAQ